METKLVKIAVIAKEKPKERFTSLYNYLNKEMLIKSHKELSGNKAVDIDEVRKAQYAENLEDNIESLVKRLKNHSYKPQVVKQVYIPKGDGKSKRTLGIPSIVEGFSMFLQLLPY